MEYRKSMKNITKNYLLVVTWFSVRILLILSVFNWWHTCKVGFVFSYPQDPIKNYLYMKLPKRIYTETVNGKTHILKLIRNSYGKKQSGRVCNKYLTNKLLTIGFKNNPLISAYYSEATQYLHYMWMRSYFSHPLRNK